MYCNDKGGLHGTVYIIVPSSKVTIKMMNLSVSNSMDEVLHVGDYYVVETPVPVNECFLDFPILTAEECQEWIANQETQSGSVWSYVTAWIARLLGE